MDFASTRTKKHRLVANFPASPIETAQANVEVEVEGSDQVEVEVGEHMVQVNWLMNEQPFTPKDQLALGLLDHLLMGTQASTLRKALTDSGLGAQVDGVAGTTDENEKVASYNG